MMCVRIFQKCVEGHAENIVKRKCMNNTTDKLVSQQFGRTICATK